MYLFLWVTIKRGLAITYSVFLQNWQLNQKSKYDFPKYFSLSKKNFTAIIKILWHVISIQIYTPATWILIEHNWWLASTHLELPSGYLGVISHPPITWLKLLDSICCIMAGGSLHFHVNNRVNHRYLQDSLSQMVSLACIQFKWRIICEKK